MERGLEIAVAARSPQAGTILNNLAVQAFFELDLRRTAELFAEGRDVAELYGSGSDARWLRAQQACWAYLLGRWDEGLERLESFVAECEAGSPHYLESRVLGCRGEIREARGDVDGALADYRHALALARMAGDPQALMPEISSAVLAFETHGSSDEARALAVELIELAHAYPHETPWTLSFAFVISRTAVELEPEVREALEHAPPGPWKELAFVSLERDFVRAADIWGAGGSPTREAQVRLRAAEELIEAGLRAEGEEQALRALEFYRSVAATHYVERCEALLREAETA